MDESIRWLLRRVDNPFASARVDNAWDPESPDVPEINRDVFEACLALVEEVRTSGRSHGLMLSGLPGTGKTHLLGRLRRQLLDDERAWFVYILPVTATDRFFRHVLKALASDVLRPSAAESTLSQVEVALARQVLGDSRAAVPRVATWWREARARHGEGGALLGFLRGALEPVADRLELEGAVLDVLLQFVARENRADARAWLLGRSVTERQAERLGVASALDDEETAEEAVTALLRLAEAPVALTFDQIEGLQLRPDDDEGLMAYAHGVAQLLARGRNLAVITCAQISFLETLRRAVGSALYDGRLAERKHSLQPLDGEQATALIAARLAASDYLGAVRRYARESGVASSGVDDPLWPLPADAVRTLAAAPRAARDWLTQCRELFEAARGPDEAAPAEAGPADPLQPVWDAALERERRAAADVIDEGVYVDGLLRVCDVVGGVTAERSRSRDVDLVVSGAQGRVGVAVCHAGHMTSLAARLRRLEQSLGRKGLGYERLAVLRDARLPISARARRTREYVEALEGRGAAVLRPPAEAYAALAAIRSLLAEAAAGDLAAGGGAVTPEQLKTWLAAHLPAPVRELFEQVSGVEGDRGEDEHEARLLDVVREARLVELQAVAERAGLTPDRAREIAQGRPRAVGWLRGTPELLFLHPDAVERR